MNIALRPFAPDDGAWLDAWLGPVAELVGYAQLAVASPGERLRARLARRPWLRADVIERDGSAAGLLVYRVHAPRRRAAIVELVATPPALARRGTGTAAAALIEERLRGDGIRVVYASAPAAHGIAVYFWIRLGYRPLSRGEWPCALDGVAWMRRDLLV